MFLKDKLYCKHRSAFVAFVNKVIYKGTIHTLLHLKCIRLVFVSSSFPCINAGVRIELTNRLKYY